MEILIAGATGEIGKRVLSRLCNSPATSIIHVLTRSPIKPLSAKIITHQTDFNDLEDLSLHHINHCICCLGSTIKKAGDQAAFYKVDHDYVVNVGKTAKKHGAASMSVVSAVGANTHSSNTYLKTKGEMERDLSDLAFPSLAIFRPSLLTGDRSEFRLAEMAGGLIMSVLNPLLLGDMSRYRSISLDTVANAIAWQSLYATKASESPTVVHHTKIKEMSQHLKELI